MQNRYWCMMFNLKFQECYIDIIIKGYQKKEMIIKIISIISSLGTVYTLFSKLGYEKFFAISTAIIQVFLMIEDYLPHKKNQKDLIQLKEIISSKFIEVSRSWYYVANGEWSEEEINEYVNKIEQEILRDTKQILSSVNFDDDNVKKIQIAQERAKKYISFNFN